MCLFLTFDENFIKIIIMEKMYYLDNAATTKMFTDVIEKTRKYLDEEYFNPSAVYLPSVNVKRVVEYARKTLLKCLASENGKLIFTGSATEANNMVVFSQTNRAGKRFLFGAGEHPSVIECAKELERRGYKIEYIPLDDNGNVDEEKFISMLDENVAFISVQHVSNETGAINDIRRLVKLARKVNPNVVFHSDGVQAFMKFPIHIQTLDVDFYTISAHKIGGPKGVGALYMKKDAKIRPLIFGGGQENGLRSGTENIFGILSFAFAAEKMQNDMQDNQRIVSEYRGQFISELGKNNFNYIIHGDGIPHTMNIMLKSGVRGETLVHALEARGIYISTGSACSATKNYNRTLETMGISKDEILSSVRISFSAYQNFNAKEVVEIIKEEIEKLEGKR